ncbi:MAG: hypothetical protein ABI772_13555, partial [Bacteroidota bacterium]
MKKIILTVIALFVIQSAFSQSIAITTGMEKLNDEFQSAFNVFIPHSTTKAASRAWVDFLKDHRGKVKTSGSDITSLNAIISEISRDTMQVYAKVSEVANGAVLVVGFQLPSGFITESTHPVEAQAIMKILHDLALPVAKDGLKDKINVAEKAYDSKVKDNESIVKSNEHLRSENEKMQNKIHENEREIKENEQKINTMKTELGTQ